MYLCIVGAIPELLYAEVFKPSVNIPELKDKLLLYAMPMVF